MIIGLLICECHIYNVHSLKEKRSIIKKLINSLRNKFNISIAETNYQDLWQRFEIGIVKVSTDHVLVEKELQVILDIIDSFSEFECTNYQIEWL